MLGRSEDRSGHLDGDLARSGFGGGERDDVDGTVLAPYRPPGPARCASADPTGRRHRHFGEPAGRSPRPPDDHGIVRRIGEQLGAECVEVVDALGDVDRGRAQLRAGRHERAQRSGQHRGASVELGTIAQGCIAPVGRIGFEATGSGDEVEPQLRRAAPGQPFDRVPRVGGAVEHDHRQVRIHAVVEPRVHAGGLGAQANPDGIDELVALPARTEPTSLRRRLGCREVALGPAFDQQGTRERLPSGRSLGKLDAEQLDDGCAPLVDQVDVHGGRPAPLASGSVGTVREADHRTRLRARPPAKDHALDGDGDVALLGGCAE